MSDLIVCREYLAGFVIDPRALWGTQVRADEIRLPGRVQLEDANFTRCGLEGPSVPVHMEENRDD